MGAENYFEQGKPLTPAGLFQLASDEVFKDGVVEDWENKVLQALARFLGLSPDKALEIARRSRDRFDNGELGSKRPLAPLALYERIVFFVCSDGVIDEREARMLSGVRRLFKVSEAHHRSLLETMGSRFVAKTDSGDEDPLKIIVEEIISNLGVGDWHAALKGYRGLRKLSADYRYAGKPARFLRILSSLVAAAAGIDETYNRSKELERIIDIFNDFVGEQPENRALAVAVIDMIATSLPLLLKVREEARAVDLLDAAGFVVTGYGHQSELATAIAECLLLCTRARTELGPVAEQGAVEQDPVMKRLTALMTELVGLCPGNEEIIQARRRFEMAGGYSCNADEDEI